MEVQAGLCFVLLADLIPDSLCRYQVKCISGTLLKYLYFNTSALHLLYAILSFSEILKMSLSCYSLTTESTLFYF